MALQWKSTCRQCRSKITVADHLISKREAAGLPVSRLCASCDGLDRRELRAVAQSTAAINLSGTDLHSSLSQFPVSASSWEQEEIPSGMDRLKFGVTDDEIEDLYTELNRTDTPMVIVVAPTGSGKSTFLPYSLLVPKDRPLDEFTQGRQIVITQPRKDATIGIAGYVGGVLRGGDVGIGHEVGFKVSGNRSCDWDNRMVYVTDGTLINWIVQGNLDQISMIIIDEAHERSLNIDVILGLMVKALPLNPHIKLLIVSATIDHEKFRVHFENSLPDEMRCGIVNCSGVKPAGLTVHYRRPDLGLLPYTEGVNRDLNKSIAQHLADAIVRIIVSMSADGTELEQGDILGFLHGAAPIDDAVQRIRDELSKHHPALAGTTDVYPLYAAVDEKERKLAIDPKKDASRRRVVIASNAAETSLTIDGLVHVVESGFIKQTIWDPEIEQSPLLPIVHSIAGCRQRWGRVGRTMDGYAWCLYSKEQFEAFFPRDTKPEIQRACLDDVVLKSKRAGAHQLTGQAFPWLDAPQEEEINRSVERLKKQGALDHDEDLTEAGVQAAMAGGEDAIYAALLADADRFGFGIEAATIVPYLKRGISDLLPHDSEKPEADRRSIQAAQDRLRSQCMDDLELSLRVHQAWMDAQRNRRLPDGATWLPPETPRALRKKLGEKTSAFMRKLGRARTERAVRGILKIGLPKDASNRDWTKNVIGSFRTAVKRIWPERHGVDFAVLSEAEEERKDLIRAMGARKKEVEDRDIDFEGLARLRFIIARAHADLIYAQAGDGRGEPGRGTLYLPFNMVDEPAHELEIARASSCSRKTPAAIVVLGPRGVVRQRNAEENIRRFRAQFVVAVDPVSVQSICEMDDWYLAAYFREHLPRPERGSEQDQRLRAHSRLRRNYPLGSLVECRIIEEIGEEIAVEVLGGRGWDPRKIARIDTRKARRSRTSDIEDQTYRFGQNNALSGGNDRPVRFQTAPEEPENDSTVDWEPTGEDYDRHRASQNRKDRKDSGTAIMGRLRNHASAALPNSGKTVIAEVARYTDLRSEPSLALAWPPLSERFSKFRKQFPIGQDVEFTVLGADLEGPQAGLRVREPLSGFESLVPLQEIASGGDAALLQTVPAGSSILLRLVDIDDRHDEVELSALPRWEKLHDELAKFEVDAKYKATVYSTDSDDERFYVNVVFDFSRPAECFLVPAKFVVPRDLYPDDQTASPFIEGTSVDIRIRPRKDWRTRVLREGLVDKERRLLKSVGAKIQGAFVMGTDRLNFGERQRLRRGAGDGFRRLIANIYEQSSRIEVDRVVPDLEALFPIGTIAEGEVIWTGGSGCAMRLNGGIKGRIPKSELSWWLASPRTEDVINVGDVREVRVISFDHQKQEVALSLKLTLEDPWNGGIRDMFPTTKTVRGEVKNIVNFGAFVSLEPGLEGLVHITKFRDFHGGFINDLNSIVTTGSIVEVSVINFDLPNKNMSLQLKKIVSKKPKAKNERFVKVQQEEKPMEAKAWDAPEWPWTNGEDAIPAKEDEVREVIRPPLENANTSFTVPGPGDWMLKW